MQNPQNSARFGLSRKADESTTGYLGRQILAVIEKHADALAVVDTSDGLSTSLVTVFMPSRVYERTSAKTLPTSRTSSFGHLAL